MEERELVIKRAKNAVISRDFSLALRLYNGLLKDDSENLDYLRAIGSIYEKTNQDEKALEYYARILKRSPVDFEALNHIGGIYRRIQKYDKAIDVLKKALATGKNNAEANYNLGFTYKLTGEKEKAIECFESVINENPGDVLAYNHLGVIYYSNQDYNKSILTYKMGLQIDSNHPILQYNLAKSYEAIKDDANAISAYESALRAKPLWIDAIKDYANLLIRLYKTKTALELVKKSLEFHENQEDLTLLLAKIYLRQNHYEEAKKILVKCINTNPDNYLSHELLAELYEEQGKFNEAENQILKAEALVPAENLRETKKLAIKILLSAGKTEEAYSRLVILSDNKIHASLIDLEGQFAICSGKTEKLDEIRKRIINAKPNYYMFYTNWAYRFMQKENYSEARKYLKKHIEKNRKSLLTWLYLGLVDEKLEYFETSREDFKMVLSLDPANYLASIKLNGLEAKGDEFDTILEEDDDNLSDIETFNIEENAQKNGESDDASAENQNENTKTNENAVENDENSSENGGENVTNSENNTETEETEDDSELRNISQNEDADILEIDDSFTPSENDYNFDEDEKSLQQELLEGEELSDFDYEMPYEEEKEPEEKTDNDNGVFVNIPDTSAGDERNSFPEENNRQQEVNYPRQNDYPVQPQYQNQYQPENPYGTGRLSNEDSRRLNDSIIRSQVNAEKAMEAAEKAWNAAQKAADSAYAIDKAEDYINKMAEDAAKRLQDTAENIQNQLNQMKERSEAENIMPQEDSFSGFGEGISQTLNPNELENVANLCPRDEKQEAYENLLSQVTQVLPLVENMLNNKEDAEKFHKEVDLFEKLKNYGDFLPEEQKHSFMTSRMRILLDFLIAKLSGKPGLLKTTDSLRKSGIFTEKGGALSENVSPEFENCTAKTLIKKVIADMRNMTVHLEDKTLAEGLQKIADEADEKLK